ncbi:thiamine transport system substrate-binding protein [Desulfocicer vacuolatum DSM 3385]|uniref:Thiamine transport system substrate-binding protein n=1 Tax=Desulfocicer vacuolatum DSM 3385 TaxID=1121400 RepID=A0A1W2BF44_9BACT|nr:thiamine ABC transporter substrate-binding protein [Desulfocicer vacuolatum]SMC71605.1 thiamine transport system substrate-binding protein [Desulfocicer vacuolatum DSM 3385]
MKIRFGVFFLVLSVCVMCGCSRDSEKKETTSSPSPSAASAQSETEVKTPEPREIKEITLMTHDSFSVSAEVIALFEKEHNAKVIFLKAGDAGEALNKAILSRNNPLADVFYGIDNTFLSRALAADMFMPHPSVHLSHVDDALKLDPSQGLLPVDFGDVCINYDRQWFQNHDMLPPTMLEDLIKPRYKGLLVIENPATSSPGLAFLLATVSRFGEDGYLEFWKQLKANDVLITSGWKEAYWGKFSAASDGDRPLVVSYASSPAAEVFYAKEKPAQSPTGVVIGHGSAFRQIEFAGILKGTKQESLARALLDFLLSPSFQADIPLQMFVFPANKKASLPQVFQEHAAITKEPATLSPGRIQSHRDLWLSQWTELML